jgi:NADH-quinone oxidoreductase subunit N
VVDINLMSVAVVAVVMSVIGAYYYLRIIKVMYFDKAIQHEELQAPVDMRVMFSVNALTVFALGIFPGSLLALCTSVFS